MFLTILSKSKRLVVSTFSTQVVAYFFLPFLTLLYTPQEFGFYGTIFSIGSVIGVVACLRFDFAILNYQDSDAKDTLTLLAILIAVASVVCLLTVVIISGWSSHFGAFGLIALALLVFFIACSNIANRYAISMQDYNGLANSQYSQGSTSIWQYFLYYVSAEKGLLTGELLGRLLSVLALMKYLRAPVVRILNRPNWPRLLRAAFLKDIHFALYSVPSALTNVLAMRSAVIAISVTYGVEAAGMLVLAQRLVSAPVMLANKTVSKVYSGEFSSSARQRTSSRKKILKKFTNYLTIPAIIFGILGCWLSEQLVSIIFGDEWLAVAEYIEIILIMGCVQLVVVPISQTVILLGKLREQVVWDVARFCAICFGFGISYICGLTVNQSLTLYVFIMTSFYVVLWFMSYHYLRVGE